MAARTLLIFTVEAYAVYVGFPRKGISRLMSNGGINTFCTSTADPLIFRLRIQCIFPALIIYNNDRLLWWIPPPPLPFAMTQHWKGAAFTVHKSLGLFKRKAPLVWDAGPSQREEYTADRKEKSKGNKSRGRRIYEMWAGTGRPASSFGDQYVKNRTSCRQQRDPSSSSCNITWKPAVYRHWTADRPAHRQRKSIAQKRGEVWVDRKSGDCHVTYKTGGAS